MARRLIFATNNRHKIEEVQQLLGERFQLMTLAECGITEDIPETADTLEGNAQQKARFVAERLGCDCFADDTGLEVKALNGEPGVRSARYATDGHDFEANNRLLLANMEGKADRTARFRTVIVLILEGREYQFEGIVEGDIATQPSGNKGFGYDPLFVPKGAECSFADMSLEAKGEISHRGRAVRKLVEFLENY